MTHAIPIIDIAGLARTNGDTFMATVHKISAACRDTGFFYCTGHDVPGELLFQAFELAQQFFALPVAAKRQLAIETIGGNRGYSGLLHEALDPARGADLKEAFNIGLELAPDDPELLAGVAFRNLNAWPDLPAFRATFLQYFDACTALAQLLHRAFAHDFGLPEDFFAAKTDRPMATLRLLHYPATAAEQIGAGEHTDYGNITLLATDAVGGLEVKTRSGTWIDAPAVPGAFIVNIGDCLMRWSNDTYISTPHRVINRSGKERFSIAFFFDPNPDAMVETIPSCILPGHTPRYAPVLAADYLKARLAASVPKGISN